jgi:4-amino-4-deoxy-L-arabinose transferase-like glycosyltransferase
VDRFLSSSCLFRRNEVESGETEGKEVRRLDPSADMNVTTGFTGATAREGTLVWGMRPLHLVLLGILFVTFFRLWYLHYIDLVPDEAYFWVWSKHFALSYRDKGPLVAWTIAAGTHLFGDTVFGVRFFAVLLSGGTAFQLFRLAERLYDDRVALWSVVVAGIIPMFSVGSILMTIDPLSVFFWAWAANLSWLAFETGKMRYWVLLGLAVGIGFLAKFTNAVQLAAVALFLCWSKPHRHFLFSRQSLATLVAFGVASFPVFWWNVETGWLHLEALHERSGIQHSFGIHPWQFLQYLGGIFAVVSPPILAGMFVAAIGIWYLEGDQARVKHLLSQFLPIQVIFLLFGLNNKGQPNWIAPSLISGIILLVVFWRQLTARNPSWRWATWSALGLSLAATVVLHAVIFLRLPLKYDPLRRAEGWLDFAQHVQKARLQNHPDFLIGNDRVPASMMQFYLPDHPFAYVQPEPYGKSQFTLWPGYTVKHGTRALFVIVEKMQLPQEMKEQFKHSQLVDDFWSEHRGRPTTHFRIYFLWNS